MEQFVLVPASVYNKKILDTQAITKHELLKYPAEQNATYQIDSLKEDINKNLFAKADSLVDKILSCPCIRLSNSQTSIFDGVETGVLLSNFGQQHRCKKCTSSRYLFNFT